jgi:hypothetical protein
MLVVGLFLLASATAAATYEFFARLPDPATADSDGLYRWLVTTDLTEHPAETRSTLISRFEAELAAGVSWDEVTSQLSPTQREQLWSNIDVLLGEWFCNQARVFADTPPEGRIQFVDGKIAEVQTWGVIDQLIAQSNEATEPASPSESFERLQQFTDTVHGWIERADRADQEAARNLLEAVRVRLIWRAFVTPQAGRE